MPRFGDVPIVTLNVGLPATAFHVHRDLLCYESPVFKAAFSENGHFLEAKKSVASSIHRLICFIL